MGNILCRAVFPHVSGLSEDVSVNDWAIMNDLTRADAAASVIEFYNTAVPILGGPIDSFFSRVFSRAVLAAHIDVYDVDTPGKLAGGPLGSPALSVPWTVSAAGGSPDHPSEVAIVMSMHADYTGAVEEGVGDTRPRARRRGRVYLGPFQTSVQGDGANNVPRPSNAIRDLIVAAGARLRDTVVGELAVWSRSDAIFRPVTVVSCDNSFDTQRRRGESATVRTSNP